jgi:predicted  nucleic acid-binding Zn-ribbon protein
LRNAFTDLGDNFLTELKDMRHEMTIEFKSDVDATNSRLSDLGN